MGRSGESFAKKSFAITGELVAIVDTKILL
jgi:hypothetical protein